MYTIHFTSGLGNQLFQFFFGESLKLLYPEIQINYKNSLLPPKQLKINDIFYSPIDKLLENNDHKNFTNYLQINFFRLAIKYNFNELFNIYSDNTLLKNNISSLNIDKNKIFYGYWQNYNYFKNSFEEIRQKLIFKKEIFINEFNEIKSYSDIVGVHCRGGDYKKKENKRLFYQIEKNYYKENIGKLLKILKKPIFIFFTDDYSYIKNLTSNLNIPHFFVKDLNNDRFDDFQLLSQCDHYIIPNSTFSLWAAYLSRQKNKIVLTPKQWFKKNKYNFEFYHKGWFTTI